MLNAFLEIFFTTCVQFIELIVPVFALWLLFDFTHWALFQKD